MLPWLRAASCLVVLHAASCTQRGALPPDEAPPSEPLPSEPPDLAAAPPHAPLDLGACEHGAFCWVHGAPIHALSAGPDGSAFAVGADGTILEWTDDGWARHRDVTNADVLDVFVGARDDVWITTYDGDVLRYDGQAWTTQPVTGSRLTGTAPDDVWVDVQHYDGRDFFDRTPGSLYLFDVLAVERGQGWLVGLPRDAQGVVDGMGAAVFRDDRSRCAQVGELLPQTFLGGARLLREQGEVWVYNTLGAVRFDGTSWVDVPGVITNGAWSFPELASSPDQIVLHDGQRFAAVPAHTQCTTLVGAGSERAFCLGPEGRLFHAEGARWTRTPYDGFGATLAPEHWGRVPPELWAGGAKLAWGTGPDHVLRVRSGEPSQGAEPPLEVLERYDGERWSELATGRFSDLDGAGDVAWIAGDQLQVYEAGTLSTVPTPPELGRLSFSAVHAVGPDSIWILALRAADGSSLLLHHAAGTLSLELTQFPDGHDPIALEDIAGTSDTDLWLLATQRPFSKTPSSALLRREGDGFSTFDLAAHGLEHVVSDGERLWLSGSFGMHAIALDALTAPSVATPAPVTPLTSGGQYPLSSGKPWLGPTDFWLTTPEQAMRTPR